MACTTLGILSSLFGSYESQRVGVPLILAREVEFSLPSPWREDSKILGQQSGLSTASGAESSGLLVATVPGRTQWSSPESISASVVLGVGEGRRNREWRLIPWHASPALCPYQVPTPPWAPSSCPGTCLNPLLAAVALPRATLFPGACQSQSLAPLI